MAAVPPAAAAGKSNLAFVTWNGASCTSTVVHRIDFGAAPLNSNPGMDVCIKNVGDISITITTDIEPCCFNFSRVGQCSSGTTLAAGASCVDTVFFDPRPDPGHYRATYTVTGDDGSSSKIGLAGRGV